MTYRRLRPGFYVDDAGEVHVDAAEFLVSVGREPTKENEDRLQEDIERILKQLGAEAEVVEHLGLPPWKGRG